MKKRITHTEYDEKSNEVINAFLSPLLPSPMQIGTTTISGQYFETNIEKIIEQPGDKYLPKSSESLWRLPMLEITTPHGVYITYIGTEWVYRQLKKNKCLVWTQTSTRQNWLWIHEGPNQDSMDLVCKGCCDRYLRNRNFRRKY